MSTVDRAALLCPFCGLAIAGPDPHPECLSEYAACQADETWQAGAAPGGQLPGLPLEGSTTRRVK